MPARHAIAARPARRWTAGTVVALVAIAALAGGGSPGRSEAATTTLTTLVADDFVRTTANGWGTAPTGGSYTVSNSPASFFSVTGSVGRVTALAPGRSAGAQVGPAVQEVMSQVAITVPGVDAARLGTYTALESRRQADGTAYRAKLIIGRSGTARLAVSRTAKQVESFIGTSVSVPTAFAGQRLMLQSQVTGTSPVVIRVRVFPFGSPTPSAWQLSVSDSSASRIAIAGRSGMWTYISSASVPTTIDFDALTVWGMTTGTPPPPVPPPAAPSRGSLPVGSAAYPIPAGAIFVNPSIGNDAAAGTMGAPLRTVVQAVARAVAGQTVVLRGGSYHERVIVSRSLTIQAYPGEAVWFEGTVPVTSWAKSGSAWVHTGWTTEFDSSLGFKIGSNDSRFLQPGYPLANRPDQVFLNDVPLRQVAGASVVTAGTFAVDYATDTLTVGSDPTGNLVRASDLTQAIRVDVPGVTLRGFGVRRFGTPISTIGSIRFNEAGSVQNVYIDKSATVGLSFSGTGAVADHVTVTDSGMMGIHANLANELSIQNSVILRNNLEHFNPWTAAGGIKVTKSRPVTVKNNNISDNYGTGVWFDESSVGIVVAKNSVQNNSEAGIEVELSDTAIIADNTVTGGLSGIYVFNSGNVRIYNNAVGGQVNQSIWLSQNARRQANASEPGHDPRYPIPDPAVPWILRNVTIANNVLGGSARDRIYVLDKETNVDADAMNILIVGNLFAKTGNLLAWGGSQNYIDARYTSVAAMQAKNAAWRNVEDASALALSQLLAVASGYAAAAVDLPADVAAAIGVAAGSRKIGPFG